MVYSAAVFSLLLSAWLQGNLATFLVQASLSASISLMLGLAPFISPPVYLYYYATSFDPFIVSCQLAYGAVILSFLGGMRWGYYLPRFNGSEAKLNWRNGIKSIIPTIFATLALIIPDLTGGLFVVSTGLVLALYNDLRSSDNYPHWMLGLRSFLTTIAIFSLLFAIILVEENRIKNLFGTVTKNKIMTNNFDACES